MYLVTFYSTDGYTHGVGAYEIVEGTTEMALAQALEIESMYPEGSPYDTRPVNVYELGAQIL